MHTPPGVLLSGATAVSQGTLPERLLLAMGYSLSKAWETVLSQSTSYKTFDIFIRTFT